MALARFVCVLILIVCVGLERVASVPCQVRASSSCLCEPFSIKHPGWGIDKACCMSPQNYVGNSTEFHQKWCYCQDGGTAPEEGAPLIPLQQVCEPDSHPTVDVAGGKWRLGEAASGALSLSYDGDTTWVVLTNGDMWSRASGQFLEFANMHIQPQPAGQLEQMTARQLGAWQLGEAASGLLAFDWGMKSVVRFSKEGVWCASSGKLLGSDSPEDENCGGLVRGRFASFGDWRMGETTTGDFGIYLRNAAHLGHRCLFLVTPEGRIWDRAAGGWIGSRIGGSMQTPGEQRHVLHLTENGRGGGLNVALGCEYDVKPRPSGTYPDPTGFLLTNGKENDNWCSKCNTWCSVGWQDSNPEVELQLVPTGGGGTVAVNRVKIHFSESKGCGIKWPSGIKTFLTRDGSTWAEVGSWPIPQALKDENEILFKYENTGPMVALDSSGGWITIELSAGMSASKLRVEVQRGGTWTVISEIRVETG